MIQEGDIYTVHTGSSARKDIVMDYSGVPEAQRSGNSSTLLISAALSCLCGTIRAALVARNAPFGKITAHGVGYKEANTDGASRLKSIIISVNVEIEETHAPVLEHCIRIVKGCLITSSLMDGIEVKHTIARA